MAETVNQSAGSRTGERQKRLLVVVDGQAAHLYYTSILLQRLEYDIHTTKTVEDALEFLDVASPALVLTETVLGGTDGLELIRKIKRNPKTYSIPVIVLTSSKDPAVKESCLHEGCAAYLQKPLDPDALYAAIQAATESVPRRYIRLNTCLNVVVGDEKTADVIGDYISALSENGMFVSSANPKPTGLEFPITIFLEDAKIRVEGVVLYSFKRGEGPLRTPGMGLRFVKIRPEDQDLIKVFIRKEITKGLTMGQIGGTVL